MQKKSKLLYFGKRTVISYEIILHGVDNYLSSFSRRGVVQERRLRQPGRRSHRSFSAPPSSFSSSLSFLQPSFPPPFFLLFSLIDAFRPAPGELISFRSSISSCSFLLLLLFRSSLFSFLLPSFPLLPSLSLLPSSFLPAPLSCLLLFLPKCSFFLLSFLPPSSEFRRLWLHRFLLVERQIGHFSNYCYRGDRALKIAMGGYFELNFSFLRVRE